MGYLKRRYPPIASNPPFISRARIYHRFAVKVPKSCTLRRQLRSHVLEFTMGLFGIVRAVQYHGKSCFRNSVWWSGADYAAEVFKRCW